MLNVNEGHNKELMEQCQTLVCTYVQTCYAQKTAQKGEKDGKYIRV